MKPLKRMPQLHLLSHDHHQGLLFCWKMRKGMNAGVESSRMHSYLKWFFEQHLQPHFRQEEEHYFPLIGARHPLVVRACAEHRELEKLYSEPDGGYEKIQKFTELLESHIRFEERELFEHMQQQVTPQQWEELEKHDADSSCTDNYGDMFWL